MISARDFHNKDHWSLWRQTLTDNAALQWDPSREAVPANQPLTMDLLNQTITTWVRICAAPDDQSNQLEHLRSGMHKLRGCSCQAPVTVIQQMNAMTDHLEGDEVLPNETGVCTTFFDARPVAWHDRCAAMAHRAAMDDLNSVRNCFDMQERLAAQ